MKIFRIKSICYWVILGIALVALPYVNAEESRSSMSISVAKREQVKIMLQGKEVAIYHTGAALDKPYIHPLWTPDGRCVTYDAPADHIHHRALSIGWPDVSGSDFWAEVISPAGKRGKMVHKGLGTSTNTKSGAQITDHTSWETEQGEVLVEGRFQWTFLPPRGNLQLVDVSIGLKAVADKVVFGSEPGQPRAYHGLTLRIGPFSDPTYFNSEGIKGGQACQGAVARWCAVSGNMHGAPVLTAFLDHPSNSSHPTRFYVQDQGMQFISTSPNYSEPKVLKKGETWNLYYRVVAAGKASQSEPWDMDKLWKEYATQKIAPVIKP